MIRENLEPQLGRSMKAAPETFWPSSGSSDDAGTRHRSGNPSVRRLYQRTALFIGLFLLVVTMGLLLPAVVTRDLNQLEGPWQEEAGSRVIHIQPERIVEFDGRGLVVRGIVNREGDRLVLRRSGLKEDWQASVQGTVLQLEHGGNTSRFRRLDRLPPQAELKLLPVAPPHEIPPDRIEATRKEIERRFKEEQAVLKDPARQGEIAAVQQDNLRYLSHLLGTAGWIDEERYGSRTSIYTLILAKHTEDLRLMMTMLPYAKEVFRKSGKAQAYALLYDAVQLDLGQKQYYGTQIMDNQGEPFLLPLEDPQNVDRHLAELGLPSLDTYLKQVETHLYNGKAVRRNPEDSARSSVSLATRDTH